MAMLQEEKHLRITAYQSLFRKLPLDQVETILIHSGAGGVGGFAAQLAKHAGKKVISTASSHNHNYVNSLGADYVIITMKM
jgi:NADPH:quinone reductase-like Zn-dependent oxidoreductase